MVANRRLPLAESGFNPFGFKCTGERRGRQPEWLTPRRKERQDTLCMDSLRLLRLCVMLFQVQQVIDHYRIHVLHRSAAIQTRLVKSESES